MLVLGLCVLVALRGGRSGPTGRACHVGFLLSVSCSGGQRFVLLNVGRSHRKLMLCDDGWGFFGGGGLSLSHPEVQADWLTVPCAVKEPQGHAMPCPMPHMRIGGPGGAEAELMSTAGPIRCHDAGPTGGVLLSCVSSGPWGNTRLRHVIF